MKSRTLISVVTIAVLAALIIPLGLEAQEKQQHKSAKFRHYTVTDLGTLGGGFSEAVGINDNGSMAGSSAIPGVENFGGTIHATLWRHGVITDLGTLGGPKSAAPEASPQPNAKGVVAGESDTTTPDPNGEDFCGFGTHLICLPFIYEKGELTPLPTLGGNNGIAWQVSNQGQVIGTAENATPDPSCSTVQLEAEPVIWESGEVQQLPTVSGDLDGWAFATNARGQVVGVTGNCNSNFPFTSFHAELWQRDDQRWSAIDLGNLGGTILNLAFGINDRGQVVGQSALPGNTVFHAFLWQDGKMSDLGTLPGDVVSWAVTINNNSQAVGTSFDANNGVHPFIWQNGVMTNLNTLLRPHSPWILVEALGNNNRGQIVGYGLRTDVGEVHAYVATPCDENHPGVDGCDYSMVEAAEVSSDTSATLAPESTQLSREAIARMMSASRNPLMRRYHLPTLRPAPSN